MRGSRDSVVINDHPHLKKIFCYREVALLYVAAWLGAKQVSKHFWCNVKAVLIGNNIYHIYYNAKDTISWKYFQIDDDEYMNWSTAESLKVIFLTCFSCLWTNDMCIGMLRSFVLLFGQVNVWTKDSQVYGVWNNIFRWLQNIIKVHMLVLTDVSA